MSYSKVRHASQSQRINNLHPLPLLMLLIISAGLRVSWLSHPGYDTSYIINSAFVPFLCACGLQFAHMMSGMFLAYISGKEFPVWGWLWMWSLVGALDANIPVFGVAPVIQRSPMHAAVFMWLMLVVSFGVYALFLTLVIGDITNYLGIALVAVDENDAKWLGIRR